MRTVLRHYRATFTGLPREAWLLSLVLLVNRAGRANQVGEREVVEFMGRHSDARLPNDFVAAQETANYGHSLAEAAPRSALVPAFEKLAAQLHEWRGLKRPALHASGGALARAGHWLKARRHGAD